MHPSAPEGAGQPPHRPPIGKREKHLLLAGLGRPLHLGLKANCAYTREYPRMLVSLDVWDEAGNRGTYTERFTIGTTAGAGRDQHLLGRRGAGSKEGGCESPQGRLHDRSIATFFYGFCLLWEADDSASALRRKK